MQSARTPYEPASPVEPDHTVADPVELLALLKDS
jgi:hypothetical protein